VVGEHVEPVAWSGSVCGGAGHGGLITAPGSGGSKGGDLLSPCLQWPCSGKSCHGKRELGGVSQDYWRIFESCSGLSPVVVQVQPFSCSSSPGLQLPKKVKGLFQAR